MLSGKEGGCPALPLATRRGENLLYLSLHQTIRGDSISPGLGLRE